MPNATARRQPRRRTKPAASSSLADDLRRALERESDPRVRLWLSALIEGDKDKK
jgi:hypothetical protein